ncbi:MAG: glutathione transferase GstA [Tropicimonas sp.]|uniref:glutathione transferase GstA n=1 Tax=Tropicimonas sp. TaxID=2067044 RepID=UPI003A83C6CF
MKLYYSPGACSLASHITLRELGRAFDLERTDIRAKTTESGEDFRKINPKGAVPALALDSGEVLTEGAAIMQYVADSAGANDLVPPAGTLERARLQEMLNYIASEVHKSYSPFFNPALTEEAKAAQQKILNARLGWLETTLSDGRAYLTGAAFSPADAYLFTVTNWSSMLGHDLSPFPHIEALRARVAERPAVQAALAAEGLTG